MKPGSGWDSLAEAHRAWDSYKLVRTLRTVRSATVRINGTEITLDLEIPEAARDILSRLPPADH